MSDGTGSPARMAGRGMLARAKVNYALHVTGRRDDGYHLLESLVAFPETGDRLTLRLAGTSGRGEVAAVEPVIEPVIEPGKDPDGIPDLGRRPAPERRSMSSGSDADGSGADGSGADKGWVAATGPRLTLSGPFAGALGAADDRADNLVLRAAAAFLERCGGAGRGAALAFHLEKCLPVASGIGGGSADAAAALRLLDAAFPGRVSAAGLVEIATALGADVPMCLAGRAAIVTGIGEAVAPLPRLPAHGLVLVNPGVPVATPAVFGALARRDNAPLPDMPAGGFAGLDALVAWLEATRNDLEPPAIALCPPIGNVLDTLRGDGGTRLVRMSGSGATCFAITRTEAAARETAARLAARHPDWWVRAAGVSPVPAASG